MFDTVRLKAKGIHVDTERLYNLYNSNPDNTVLRRNITSDGEAIVSYEWHIDKQLPFIKYVESSKTLYIQCSIPKFLYGENITMVNQDDVSRFFDLLQEKLLEILGVIVQHEQWITTRADLCYNFYVDSVSDYIKQLAKLKLPYRNTVLWNHDETVYFLNKSSEIKFYDKEKESEDERARGILRMEIQPSDNVLRDFSQYRKAVDILSINFYCYEMDKVLPQIVEKLECIASSVFTDEWLRSEKIQNIEKVIAFRALQQNVDESTLIDLYGRNTYRSRMKLLKDIALPTMKRFDLKLDQRISG